MILEHSLGDINLEASGVSTSRINLEKRGNGAIFLILLLAVVAKRLKGSVPVPGHVQAITSIV